MSSYHNKQNNIESYQENKNQVSIHECIDLYLFLKEFNTDFKNTTRSRIFAQEAVYFGQSIGIPIYYKFDISTYKIPISLYLQTVYITLANNLETIEPKTTDYTLTYTCKNILKKNSFKPHYRYKPFSIKQFKNKFNI